MRTLRMHKCMHAGWLRNDDFDKDVVEARVCMGDLTTFDLHFGYLRDFMSAYATLPKFTYSHFFAADHYPDGAGMRLADKRLMLFLQDEKTFTPQSDFVLLMGDHGWAYGPWYRTPEGYIDHKRPFLAILAPRRFLTSASAAALEANQRVLVTMHDVSTTIRHVPYITDVSRHDQTVDSEPLGSVAQTMFGHSLLAHLPDNRTCADAGVPASLCSHNGVPEPAQTSKRISRELELGIADALIEDVNQKARAGIDSGACIKLPMPSLSAEWAIEARASGGTGTKLVNVLVTLQHDVSGGRCPDQLAFFGEFSLIDNKRLWKFSDPIRASPYSHEDCVDKGRQFCVCRRDWKGRT